MHEAKTIRVVKPRLATIARPVSETEHRECLVRNMEIFFRFVMLRTKQRSIG